MIAIQFISLDANSKKRICQFLLMLVLMAWPSNSLMSQTLSIQNDTYKSVNIRLRTITSTTGKKYSSKKIWNLKRDERGQLSIKNINVASATYSLRTSLGSIERKVSWNSKTPGDRVLTIKPAELPIIKKQKKFRKWQTIHGEEFKGKYVHHIEAGEMFVQLLMENGKIGTLKLNELKSSDQKWVERIEKRDEFDPLGSGNQVHQSRTLGWPICHRNYG